MADVFISYRKDDYTNVKRVVDALVARGLSVWWDESLTARSAWDTELEGEIAAAAAVVVLWTPRSVESDWVRTEAHYAQNHGKLIPVMLEPCTIPLAFLLRQTIDLCHWNDDADHRQWQKLLAWIVDVAATRTRSGTPQALGAPKPNAFRRAVGLLPSGDPIEDGGFVTAATPAGTAFRDTQTLPVMRVVPAGAYMLGSPDREPGRAPSEGPQKRVEIPAPFAAGVFPVLQAEYDAIVTGRAAASQDAGAALLPATHVSFDDALAFVAAASSQSGETYRLPSETEWEYACRAGTRTRYAVGDTIDGSRAVYGASTGPASCGACPPNGFGLYDMHGNVREWTADLWHESYLSTPDDGSPALEGHSSMRVVRGGGWSDSDVVLRSAARMRATQSIRSPLIGFRVVRVLG